MHSALYHGWLDHRRLAPRRHAFRYRLFMAYLDLAEVRFDRRDHFGDPALPLDEAVRALVAERTGQRPAGPIRLLTNLRWFGYVFNPVSFYYCFDAADRAVETVVAEVNNTPWGERHCYVLRQDMPGAERLCAQSVKAMHVSPFHPMGLRYDWQLHTPGDALGVHMALREADAAGAAPIFGATLALQRLPISGAALAGTLLRYPFMTAKVIAAIHWEALRLWLKRVPVHDHPAKARTASSGPPLPTEHSR